jgi:hypothetical protein
MEMLQYKFLIYTLHQTLLGRSNQRAWDGQQMEDMKNE